MKKVLFLFLILSLCLRTYGQEIYIDTDKIIIGETLTFTNIKQKITNELGENYKQVEPNYECGFHSKEEQGKDYFQLKYRTIQFIGNEEEGYIPESISFFERKISVKYGDYLLSNQTTKEDLEKIFHLEKINDHISVQLKNRDDKLNFIFKNNHLVKIEYWSPC